ncbi:hypothetical protein LINPERPRIM_LOCUS21989 [Linum perenne]
MRLQVIWVIALLRERRYRVSLSGWRELGKLEFGKWKFKRIQHVLLNCSQKEFLLAINIRLLLEDSSS